MVNNAGASFRAKPEDISINGWNTVIGINLNGVFLGCKWAGKQMMQQKTGGVIVNIASVAGVYGSTMMSHYGASKSAVITLTRELGSAWGRQGVRVNCIAPGLVKTDFARALWENPDTLKAVTRSTPLRRIGEPHEIAGAAVYLASPASTFMTGQAMIVDGGSTIGVGL